MLPSLLSSVSRHLLRPSALSRVASSSTPTTSRLLHSTTRLSASLGSGQGGKADKAAAAKVKLSALKAKEKERAAREKAKVKAAEAKVKQREKEKKAIALQKEKAIKADKLKKDREKKKAQIKVKSAKKAVRVPKRSSLHPPTAPKNAWAIFSARFIADRRAELSEGEKLPSVPTLMKEAAPIYQQLPPSERADLISQAQAERAAYPEIFNKWLESLTPAQIKEENSLRLRRRKEGKSNKSNLKVPGAPKKPLTGFMRFSAEVRKERPEVLEGEENILKQSGLVAKAWKALSEEERKVYNDAAAGEREKYYVEKEKFDKEQEAKVKVE